MIASVADLWLLIRLQLTARILTKRRGSPLRDFLALLAILHLVGQCVTLYKSREREQACFHGIRNSQSHGT
jgi:hypothetical protein